MPKRFYNPFQKDLCRNVFHFILWKAGYYKDKELLNPVPANFSYPKPLEAWDSKKPSVTWVNHSTFWIKGFGKSLLTDPIWNDRCSPVSFLGPKRRHAANPPIDEISSVDFILISHNHYDHLDLFSLRTLIKRFPHLKLIIPRGIRKWFKKHLPEIPKGNIFELGWYESCEIENLKFTAVPCQHFSGRGILDLNRTLWIGCMVEFPQGKKMYFAGDTGYNPFQFKEIGEKFGPVDLSLIPIGTYLPRPFMRGVHINPEESVIIHKEVQSKLSVGGHWNTFHLSDEPFNQPPYDLYRALEKEKIPTEQFYVLNPGESINW